MSDLKQFHPNVKLFTGPHPFPSNPGQPTDVETVVLYGVSPFLCKVKDRHRSTPTRHTTWMEVDDTYLY